MGAIMALIIIICIFGFFTGVKLMGEGSGAGQVLVFVCGVIAIGTLKAMARV